MHSLIQRYSRKYHRQSIAQKLIIWVLVLGASVMIIGASLRVFIFHYETKHGLETRAELMAFFLEKPLQNAIKNNNKTYVNTVIKDIAQYPDIVNVTLSYESNGSFITVNESSSKFREKDVPVLNFRYSLKAGDNTAYLALIFKHPIVSRDTTSKLVYNMLIEIFILMSIVVAVLYFIRHLVTKHLHKISNFARNLSLDTLPESLVLERTKYQKEKGGQDELDHVVDALEHMRQRLLEDIEERHSMEQALISETQEKNETKRLAEEAKASNQAKSQFIATMSHEIRTPMNGIVGMVEMLRDTPMNDDQKAYVDVIYRSTESLMGIIDDILDYSKIEAGKLVLDQNEFDLTNLIQDCMQLFSATAQKRKLELITNITPETPTLLVGDTARLKQILVNLLGNAFKFTSEGHVLVQANLVNSDSTNHTIRFCIMDSGIGIEESVHETLFDAFRQADGSTTRRFGGTGLGLAICKQLVELMGGHIGLSSQPAQGSHFWFTCVFPVTQNAPPTANQTQHVRRLLSNKNVLLVHESNCIEGPLKSQCEYYDMHLNYGDSGLNALEIIHSAEKRFDFIVLNESVGKTSGTELAIAIRKLSGYKNTPVFLLSNNSQRVIDNDDNSIVSAIINRPLNISNLIQAMAGKVEAHSVVNVPEINTGQQKAIKLKVLVAEDNAINRMVIEGLLKKFEAEPIFCENGVETVSVYEEKSTELNVVFMDCEMPEMDGFEATQKIRDFEKVHHQKRIPIIALTAHVEDDHRKRVFDVGMDYYLSKPITYEKLNEALMTMHLV